MRSTIGDRRSFRFPDLGNRRYFSFHFPQVDLLSELFDRLQVAVGDRYNLEAELGAGGMAIVYRALDRLHDRGVAIKVLRPELAAAIGSERFLREIKVTAALTHPNILPVLDSGGTGDLLYYVMPLVEGESLREALDRGSLSIERAVQFATEAADALGSAHRHGIVHRDIKPENILLVEGHAVIADFGIATAMSGASEAKLTETGMSIGTPLYMSPEQAAGESVDVRSDVYSMGCTLFECLAGRPPFTGPTAASIVQQHLTADPPAIATIRTGVSDALGNMVAKTLAKNPADRFEDGSRLAEALKRSAAATVTVHAARPRRRPWAVPVGLAVAAVIAVAGWWMLPRGGDDAPAVNVERVAVFPFAVRSPDPEHEYLGDGLAELLSTALDGAGDLRVVDPGVVIARRPADDRHEATARELGAGRYISGSVAAAGRGRVQVRASLYSVGDSVPVSAQVTGAPDDLLELTTALGRELLVGHALSAQGRVDSLALSTTDSVEALKAYLRGLRHYRASEWDEAIDALSQAVAIDSGFAIAYLPLALAASWAERSVVATRAAEAGLRASRDQSVLPRHRRLLEMSAALERGDGPTLEAQAREVLREYPNDFDALYMLGEIRSHNGPFYGRPASLAREPFERAFRLDPGRGDVTFHLTFDVAFGHRDLALLDTVLVRRGVDTATSLVRRTLVAYTRGDAAARAAVLADSRGVFLQPVRIGWFLGELADAAVLVQELASDATDPLSVVYFQRWQAWLTVGQGQLRFARRVADSIANLAPVQGAELAAYVAALPFLSIERDILRAVRDNVSAVDAGTAQRCTVARSYVCVHDDVHEYIKTYLLGVLSVKLGDRAAAERQVATLESLTGSDDARALGRDLSLGIQAAIATEAGRLEDALQLLERTSTARKVELVRDSQIFALVAERYRQADVLARLGQNDEALRRFESLEVYPDYRAATYLRRGEIFESLGQRDSAVAHYARFVDLWRNADREYQPLVEDVRARLARLTEERR